MIAFQRATKPLPPMIERLIDDPSLDEDERRYLRYMQDLDIVSHLGARPDSETSRPSSPKAQRLSHERLDNKLPR